MTGNPVLPTLVLKYLHTISPALGAHYEKEQSIDPLTISTSLSLGDILSSYKQIKSSWTWPD